MNKTFTDIKYMMLINELGEHLQDKYKISHADLQELKYKINQLVEKAVRNE